MRSGILRTRVAALRLNPRAPFPSQIGARQNYQMRALRSVCRIKCATVSATMHRKA